MLPYTWMKTYAQNLLKELPLEITKEMRNTYMFLIPLFPLSEHPCEALLNKVPKLYWILMEYFNQSTIKWNSSHSIN